MIVIRVYSRLIIPLIGDTLKETNPPTVSVAAPEDSSEPVGKLGR